MNVNIDTKSARNRLAVRIEPYWQKLSKGCYVGFRKTAASSNCWLARKWDGSKYEWTALGRLESFEQAKREAEVWFQAKDQGCSLERITVSTACRNYVDFLRASRPKTAKDAEGRFKRLVYDKPLGKTLLAKLQAPRVRDWLNAQLGEEEDAGLLRKKKASANRNLSNLKAALNQAYRDRLVMSDSGWATVTPFKQATKGLGPEAYLDRDERQRFLAACDPDAELLAKAVLYTGARPGELASLNISDYDRKQRRLNFRVGKNGGRQVPVSDKAAAFFESLLRTAIGEAPLLRAADGRRWNKDIWKLSIRRAVNRANLNRPISLYSLRHTTISDMVMVGIDTFQVAKLTGTSVRMIELTYGHIKADTLREGLNRLEAL